MLKKLERKISWKKSVFLISGCYGIAIYSTGGALEEIGNWSILVWVTVVLTGLLQAYLLADLAGQSPDITGGTATYAHHVFKGKYRVIGFISSWCYEIAWVPGIAVNCLLIHEVLSNLFPFLINYQLEFTILLLMILYGVNWWGLGKAIITNYAVSIALLIPFLALVFIAINELSYRSTAHLLNYPQKFNASLFWKWFFVTAWTGYAVEMISSLVSETIATQRYVRRMFVSSGLISTFAFTGIPILLVLITPDRHLTDPFAALLPLFRLYFGEAGMWLLSLLLVAVLLFSALGFIVPTTRTVYQMSKDGLLPPYFSKINKYGAPSGSFLFDVVINIILLLLFRDRLISLIATANIAYIIVFLLLPVVYYAYHRQQAIPVSRSNRCVLILVFIMNAICLFYGGSFWGSEVVVMGWSLVLLGVPVYYGLSWTNNARKKKLTSCKSLRPALDNEICEPDQQVQSAVQQRKSSKNI